MCRLLVFVFLLQGGESSKHLFRLLDDIESDSVGCFEVEAEVVAYEAVREAAAYAVPSDVGEDEVMVAVAPVEGQAIDAETLVRFLGERMAHFMVPRYIRILDELPKTPSSKVMKHVLRNEGVTSDTWDRAAIGLQFKRETLSAQ